MDKYNDDVGTEVRGRAVVPNDTNQHTLTVPPRPNALGAIKWDQYISGPSTFGSPTATARKPRTITGINAEMIPGLAGMFKIQHAYYDGYPLAVLVEADKCSSTCGLVVEHHGPCWDMVPSLVCGLRGALAFVVDVRL
jgi:hypothetical protein